MEKQLTATLVANGADAAQPYRPPTKTRLATIRGLCDGFPTELRVNWVEYGTGDDNDCELREWRWSPHYGEGWLPYDDGVNCEAERVVGLAETVFEAMVNDARWELAGILNDGGDEETWLATKRGAVVEIVWRLRRGRALYISDMACENLHDYPKLPVNGSIIVRYADWNAFADGLLLSVEKAQAETGEAEPTPWREHYRRLRAGENIFQAVDGSIGAANTVKDATPGTAAFAFQSYETRLNELLCAAGTKDRSQPGTQPGQKMNTKEAAHQ